MTADSRAVGKPHVELRVGGVERAARQPGVGREHLNELDQLLVAFRDRLAQCLPAVGEAEKHPVIAVDVDVLDLLVLEQRLEPAHAEQGGVDRLGEILLLLGIERRVPGHDLGARVLFEHLGDQRPRELALVLR